MGGAPPLPHDFAPEGVKNRKKLCDFGPRRQGWAGGRNLKDLGPRRLRFPGRVQPELPRRRGRTPHPRFSEGTVGTRREARLERSGLEPLRGGSCISAPLIKGVLMGS